MIKACCVECEKHKKKFGWEIDLHNGVTDLSFDGAMLARGPDPVNSSITIKLYQGTKIVYEISCRDSRNWDVIVSGMEAVNGITTDGGNI